MSRHYVGQMNTIDYFYTIWDNNNFFNLINENLNII